MSLSTRAWLKLEFQFLLKLAKQCREKLSRLALVGHEVDKEVADRMLQNGTDVVALALELSDLVEELRTDWEYLSEEQDRWGTRSRFTSSTPPTDPTELLIASHLSAFEEKYRLAMKTDLPQHRLVGPILQRGRKMADRITGGRFAEYPVSNSLVTTARTLA